MSMSQPLLDLARRTGTGEVSEREHQEGKERLLTALAAEGVIPERRSWRYAAGAAALAAAAILLFIIWPSTSGLQYTVAGGSVEGGYVTPTVDGAATVSFSDDSQLIVQHGSRARIAQVVENGARIVLEQGVVHLRVTPREGADWSVQAGPYTVLVTGTEFDVRWQPNEGRLEVAMQHGSVRVSGSLAKDGVAVKAGERLIAERGELLIRRGQGSGVRGQGATEPGVRESGVRGQGSGVREPQPEPDVSAEPKSGSRSESAATPAKKSWATRVAEGDFKGVVRDAEALGIGSVAETAPLGDLIALADAARYAGRSDIARQCLLAQRARFAGSAAATAAAFLLGRMADAGGQTARAIQLYDAYLAEGGGAFAAEALGRKMAALDRSGSRDAARAVAQQYVGRYPNGGYAKLARALLE